MPRKRAAVAAAKELDYSPDEVQRYFNRVIREYQVQHLEDESSLSDMAEQMQPRLDRTTWSQIRNGRRRATPEQCFSIARRLERPVEEVLRLFQYPDARALQTFVKQDKNAHDERERDYILTVFQYAFTPAWQQTTWQTTPYREQADVVLSLNVEPYMKARLLADTLYNWARDPERNVARGMRRTDEHPVLQESAQAS